ncbi:DNA-3-methyladenine glycosylase-like isoform X1 [Pseudomyrmex gracilis]|uniref:DNA-3-methyladenine glycosylase-like isoform X1 n=1 Tax=Pseudomyrmex gracilis TaxID=219809 RepID=UPI000994ACCC|nr:DNA-3-methyladenine glycosylase-like isoform X1 [Pseudomyrmex gracilis]
MRYLFVKSVLSSLKRLQVVNRFFREDQPMKRRNIVTKFQQQNVENNENDKKTTKKNQSSTKIIPDERPKLNLRSLRNQNNETTNQSHATASLKKSKNNQKESHINNDKKEENDEEEKEEELKPNTSLDKKKLRAIVDLKKMKEELKQLEDPPLTPWEKEASSKRLQYEFYDVPCEDLAQRLLGKILVRYLDDGTILKGRIVETEGYLGAIDKASQSYQNRITSRNLPMYMPPGTIYVYMTYGMYHCFNISSQGDGCAVLVRAVDPLEGIERMAEERNTSSKAKKTKLTSLKPHELCNGPSKFCMAYQLTREHNRYSLCTWKSLWIEDDGALTDFKIIKTARIGIDSSGPEWSKKPLRYYIYDNKSISKRDKKAETEIS